MASRSQRRRKRKNWTWVVDNLTRILDFYSGLLSPTRRRLLATGGGDTVSFRYAGIAWFRGQGEPVNGAVTLSVRTGA